jgi:hypothetical protein
MLAAAVQSITYYNLLKKLDRTSNNMSDAFPLALNSVKERGSFFYSDTGERLRSHKGTEPTNGHAVRPLLDRLMNIELWLNEN